MSRFQNSVKAARQVNIQRKDAQALEERQHRERTKAYIQPILDHLEEKDNYKLMIDDAPNHYSCRYRARVVIPSECGTVVIESGPHGEYAVGRATAHDYAGRDKRSHARTFSRSTLAILYAAVLSVAAREEDIAYTWQLLEAEEEDADA